MGPRQPTRKVRAREGGQQRPRPSVPALPVRRPKPVAAHPLRRLGTGPSLSSLSLSCFARKTRACRPWHARSPGKGSTGPFAMPRFTHGLGVRRDERPPDARLIPAHPLDCCLSPAHPSHACLCPTHLPDYPLIPPRAGILVIGSRPGSRPSLTPDTLGEVADQVATRTGPSRGRGCQG